MILGTSENIIELLSTSIMEEYFEFASLSVFHVVSENSSLGI